MRTFMPVLLVLLLVPQVLADQPYLPVPPGMSPSEALLTHMTISAPFIAVVKVLEVGPGTPRSIDYAGTSYVLTRTPWRVRIETSLSGDVPDTPTFLVDGGWSDEQRVSQSIDGVIVAARPGDRFLVFVYALKETGKGLIAITGPGSVFRVRDDSIVSDATLGPYLPADMPLSEARGIIARVAEGRAMTSLGRRGTWVEATVLAAEPADPPRPRLHWGWPVTCQRITADVRWSTWVLPDTIVFYNPIAFDAAASGEGLPPGGALHWKQDLVPLAPGEHIWVCLERDGDAHFTIGGSHGLRVLRDEAVGELRLEPGGDVTEVAVPVSVLEAQLGGRGR